MNDSLKGLLVTFVLASLFITSILSFITVFPQEQGVSFSSSQDNSSYLVIQGQIDTGTENNLNSIDNSTSTGFNEWDVTQGFMGSNTLKQSSGTNIKSYSTNIFSTLNIISNQLFSAYGTGSNNPILYVIGIFAILAGTIITFLVIKWVRTGN